MLTITKPSLEAIRALRSPSTPLFKAKQKLTLELAHLLLEFHYFCGMLFSNRACRWSAQYAEYPASN